MDTKYVNVTTKEILMNDKDHCTAFPEYWYAWTSPISWKKIYIGDCCEGHDNDCRTSVFFKCLRKKRIVGGLLITIGGLIGCLVMYQKK